MAELLEGNTIQLGVRQPPGIAQPAEFKQKTCPPITADKTVPRNLTEIHDDAFSVAVFKLLRIQISLDVSSRSSYRKIVSKPNEHRVPNAKLHLQVS